MARVVFLLFVSLAGAALLTGCVSTPVPDGPAKVDINAVVARIKCDIWRTVGQRIDSDPARFGFLAGWGAKAHLTVAVDATASINPGATIINPLLNGQSFSLGAGAGLLTEAINTKDIEFFLSFADMRSELARDPSLDHYGACRFDEGVLLESDLHLEELFDSALAPVGHDRLTIGNHPGVAGGSAQPIPPDDARRLLQLGMRVTENAAAARAGRRRLTNKFDKALVKAEATRKRLPDDAILEVLREGEVDNNRKEAMAIEVRSHAIVDNIVKPLADIIASSFPACVATVTQAKTSATVRFALITSDRIAIDAERDFQKSNGLIVELRSKEDTLIDLAQKVINDLKQCPRLRRPVDQPPLFDPLDLISETVNFYITASGSVTPSWKLTRVSAPLAPGFLTASRRYTNTLILAFGRPGQAGATTAGKSVTDQILVSNLRDALNGDRFRP